MIIIYCVLILTKICANCRGCDACEEWYHGDCINITEKDAKHIKQFFCIVSTSVDLIDLL